VSVARFLNLGDDLEGIELAGTVVNEINAGTKDYKGQEKGKGGNRAVL